MRRARSLLAIVALTLLAGCVDQPSGPSPRAVAPPLPSLIEDSPEWHALQFTVRVRNLACDSLGVGSGFLVDANTLVTNRHVVEGARRLWVSTWDGRQLEVEADSVATIADLAIVRLRHADIPVATLAGADAAVGSSVHAVGYPGGGRITATEGKVLGFRDGPAVGNTGQVVEIDALIRPGNSGGPVVDEHGNVVAVVYATDTLNGTGLAIPMSTVRAVMSQASFAPEADTPC